jgi:hypothetical protein
MLPVQWALLLMTALHAQQECAGCHPKEVERHARTNHAHTLRPVLETEFARALPSRPIGEARGGYLLTYARRPDGIELTASRGTETATALIAWAFGAGDQGVTPVARLDGRWYEHRISYYTRPGRFDLTLGHAPGVSRNARAAIGIEQPDALIGACFRCHGDASRGENVEGKGVSCERCHAGAAAHARTKAKVENPGKLSPRAQVELCAACHRLTPPNGNAADPLNIRFQPLRLIKSKCYKVGNLNCLTCHPAHENARRNDAAFYRAKCLSCHANQSSKGDCLSCHMKKSSPAPYLAFTDHFIR